MNSVEMYDWNKAVDYAVMMSKIDTYNYEGKVELLNKVKEEIINNTDAEVVIYGEDIKEPYLIASVKVENPQFKMLIQGHIDVVSPEGVEKPFDAEIKDGIMFGRGVCDMKGGCGAQLMSFITAAKEEGRKGDIYLMFSSDEEYSSQQIIRALENNHLPKCDMTMIAEPTNCTLGTAHKGNAWMDVEFLGKSAHASTPELGINSVYMASAFTQKLIKYIDETYPKMEHEIYGKPTMNLGVINGGSEPNLVPPYAKVSLDKRYLPGDSYDSFDKEIQDIIDECKKEDPTFNANIIKIGDWPAVITERDSEDLVAIHGAMKKATKEEIELSVINFWGEGGFIQQFDIPVIYYGPGHAKYAHTPDEQIPVEEIVSVAKGYYGAIKETCF